MIVTAGKDNVTVYFYIVQDASAGSPGEPKTGLLFSDIETGGSASFVRQGAARTDFELFTLASASASHTDGGFILVDDTNLPGVYRCDVPNAAFATGVDEVTIGLVVESSNNAAVSPLKVQIYDVDLRDAVSMGITALPAVAAGSAGGVATDTDSNGAVRIVDGTGAREINTNVGAIALVDLVTTTTTNTDVRGTDNAALASVLGALADASAVGDVTTADTVMQYVKQLLDEVSGSTGIGSMPTLQDPASGTNLFEIVRAGMGATFASATDSMEQLQADHVAIQSDTDDLQTQIGTAGAGLSDLGGMSTGMKAEIAVEVGTGLKDSGVVLSTSTIETATNQTNFIIPNTADATDDDAYKGATVVFIDGTDSNQVSIRRVKAYTASSRSIEIDLAPDFTVTNSDKLIVLSNPSPSQIVLPGQEAPPLSPTIEQAWGWLYKALRNRTTQTATQWSLLADDESTVDAKATVSDDSTTAIVQEIVTGP